MEVVDYSIILTINDDFEKVLLGFRNYILRSTGN